MPIIPFNEWIPDASDLGNPGSVSIRNAVPSINSYQPHPSLVTTTSALTDYPRGAIEAKDAAENVYQYAGDETNLYELVGSTWTDVSKVATTYTTATKSRWTFVRWKEKIIATNYDDNPQQIGFSGANFTDLTTALRFRHVGVVGDFVVAGDTFDGTDGARRDRVRWSAIGDETDWTVSPTTLAGYVDLNVGGGIQQIVGGQYGVILSERSVFRMVFVGTPKTFQIDEVMPGVGVIGPGCAAVMGNTVYFPSEHGFVALRGGANETFIGAGRVDEYFRNDLDEDYVYRISTVADPKSRRVYWAYPGAGNTAGRPNRVIVYDTVLNKWGILDIDVEFMWRAGGVGSTLEQLDTLFGTNIDTDVPVSLDDASLKGSAPLLAGFDTAYTSGSFSGVNLDATLVTKETELHTGSRTQLNGFKPLINAGTVTARVGYRNRQADLVSWTPSLTLRNSGRFTRRVNANYHRFELSLSDGWTDAIGVQVEPRDARKAEGRG
jgi:hypothetical protein